MAGSTSCVAVVDLEAAAGAGGGSNCGSVAGGSVERGLGGGSALRRTSDERWLMGGSDGLEASSERTDDLGDDGTLRADSLERTGDGLGWSDLDGTCFGTGAGGGCGGATWLSPAREAGGGG